MIPNQAYTTPDGICQLSATDYDEPNYGRELLVVTVTVNGIDVTETLCGQWNRIPMNLSFRFCGELPFVFLPFEKAFVLFDYLNNDLQRLDFGSSHNHNAFVENRFNGNLFLLLSQRILLVRDLLTGKEFAIESKADEMFEEIVSISDTHVVLRKSMITVQGNHILKQQELRETVDLRKEMEKANR